MPASPAGQHSTDDREFLFTDGDFHTIVSLVKERVGIVLAEHKRDMVYSRLARRLRELGMERFSDYLKYLESPSGADETIHFVNAITTNLTSFFRESHHFDHLAGVLKNYAADPHRQRVRLWSAGCSSGMEPYSIAMTAMESAGGLLKKDFKLLATDIDTNMLARGQRGVYAAKDADGIPAPHLSRYVSSDEEQGQRVVVMGDQLKQLISFKRLNLLEPWPVKGPFDIIFCRNVVIYFDKDTQRVLFDRFADVMQPNGWLYIGHSENLNQVSDRFKLIGRTIYQKIR